MDTVDPTMFLANGYFTTRSRESKAAFKKATEDKTEGSNNALSLLTNPDLHNEHFTSTGQNISMWIPFNLNYTFLFQYCAKSMEESPLFDHGNYCGKNEKNDSTPMDFMWMKTFDDKYHRVDNIKDFAIINQKHAMLLDTRQLAHLLFVLKEDRLVDSQEVDFIRNIVHAWLDDSK